MPDQDLRTSVIRHCASLPPVWARSRITRFGKFAVKFGKVSSDEAENQRHASALLDKNIGRVPEVHDYFTMEGSDYLVMDFIIGECRSTIEDDESLAAVARLVCHLHSFTSDHPGAIESGNLSGVLWPQNEETPCMTSTLDLQQYVNSRLPGSRRVSFCETPLVLVHGDLAPRNIIFGPGGLWLLDWEFSGYYPRTVEFASLHHDCVSSMNDLHFRDELAERLHELKPLTAMEREQTELLLVFSFNCIRYSWTSTTLGSKSAKKPRRPTFDTQPLEDALWLRSMNREEIERSTESCPPLQLRIEF